MLLFYRSSFAQNWFPLEVGNTWQYLRDLKVNLTTPTHTYSLTTVKVVSDTFINSSRYFRIENLADYGTNFLFHFDQNSKILFGRIGETEYIVIDFTKLHDYTYFQIAPDGTFRNARVLDYHFNFLDTTFSSKGFLSNGNCYFTQNIGPIYMSNYPNIYTSNFYYVIDYSLMGLPPNNLRYKTTIADSLYPKNVSSGYNFIIGKIVPSHPHSIGAVQFVDKMWVEWFYKKNNNILNIDTISGTYIAGLGKFSFTGESFNFNLLEDGYSINYRYIVKTKYLQNNIEYVPESGYIKIEYPKKSFLPFAVNNKWKYNEYYFPAGSNDSIFVRSFWLVQNGDSITVNNKKYFEIENTLSGFKNYYRFDVNDPNLYLYDSIIGPKEYIIENVDKKINDILFDSRFGQNHKVKYTTNIITGKFFISSEERTYSSVMNAESYYILKDSIGLIYQKQNLNYPQYDEYKSTVLQEAYINGRHFITDVVGINNEPRILDFSLSQNYPNPFNPTTKIKFTISDFGYTTLKIYDILGNEVAVLVDEEKSPGIYSVEFDASTLSSGVYIYTITAGSFSSAKKLVLIK